MRYVHTHVYSSITHKSQNVEAMVFMNESINKQNVIHSCHGMLFSIKKERNPDPCYNMDEP